MNYPTVAVIIPTYNDQERLKLCLDGIQLQTFPLEKLKVYVVDNNSSQDIKGLVGQYSFCEYLHEAAPGAYNARNKALRALGGEDYIGFTDADCIPEPDWIENAVSLLGQDPNLAIGGDVKVFSTQPEANIYEQYEMLFAFPQQTYIQSDHFAVTANLFTSRKVVDKVGEFNTALFSGGDAEWGSRLETNRVRLNYSSDVKVHHPARNSFRKLTSKVKRTVGGCYQQRQINPVMARSFSLIALCKGYVPPVRAVKQLYSMDTELSSLQKLKMIGLLTWFKYHKNTIKLMYKIGIIKDFERF